jgi:hypothetical protein
MAGVSTIGVALSATLTGALIELRHNNSSIFKPCYPFVNFSLTNAGNTVILRQQSSMDVSRFDSSAQRNFITARCSMTVQSESAASMFA